MDGGDDIANRRNIIGAHPKSFIPEPLPPPPERGRAPEKADEAKEEAPKEGEKKADAAPKEGEKKADAAAAPKADKAAAGGKGGATGAAGPAELAGPAPKAAFVQMDKTDAIGEVNYDPWVYEFSRDNMAGITMTHA